MANSSLDLTALDVPSLEASLTQYLQSQDVFKDYDFQGSNLAALVRILAYNTYKNSWLLNMVAAEGFLDSAQTMSAMLSHSKELNYVPDSGKSASAVIQVSFSGAQSSYLIQKGQSFSSTVKSRGLVFTVPDATVLTSVNGSFSANLSVYEGAYVQDAYVMNYSDDSQRFILTSNSSDTDSLAVGVYEDGKTTPDQYVASSTMLGVTDQSLVYFLQAAESGQYEVVFGDGVVGRRPADGATIILDYRVTVGTDGNGAQVFSRDFDMGQDVTNVVVSTISSSAGGSNAESIESIRYYAPRHFQVQERAVTAEDYAIMLKTQFPEISAVAAYGGEDADPPQYGKVFVAVDVSDVDGIPQSKRDKYADFLKKRVSLTVEPVFVEPKYLYLSIDSSVLYDTSTTTMSSSSVGAVVSAAVFSFAQDNVDDFGTTLRYSRLVATIDGSHPSIVSNSTTIDVYKRVPVTPNSTQSLSVSFGISLYDGYPEAASSFPIGDQRTIRSDTFSVGGESHYLTDDGGGVLWTAVDRGATTVLLDRVGVVDYSRGAMTITNLTLEDAPSGELRIYGRPSSLDVSALADTILQLEQGEVSITTTPAPQ